MTKSELLEALKDLEATRASEKAALEAIVHELHVHQAELEMQNVELRETQQLLEASRERYAQLYDFSPVGYLGFDRAGCVQEVNLAAAALLGTPRLDLIGKPFVHYVAPADRGSFRSHLRQCWSGPSKVNTELRLQAANNLVEIELCSVRPADDGGRDVLCHTAMTDITERRKADRKFKELLEAAPDAMVIANREGEIVLVNAQAEKLFGYTRAELLGQPVEMLLPARYRGKHAGQRTEFFAEPKARPMGARPKLYGLRKDGVEVPVEISLSPLETAEGTLVSAAIRDITERMEAAMALESSHRQLRELSAHLESVREEERTRIARGLHDDLGATFLTIKMALSACLGEISAGLTPGQAGKLREIMDQVDAGMDSVRRIATDLRPSILDTLGVLAAIEWYAQDMERRSGIECEVVTNGSEREWKLEGAHATALFRIVQEALTNVVRHSEATRVCISVGANARGVELRIEDNGKGFVPDRPAARPTWGLVGMSERVAALSGEFSVASAPQHGTTVKVHLPKKPRHGSVQDQDSDG
ncbi:MAG: hypothetical protein A3G24_13925 [Betaproteobacteria bacterium RIFCSPLOWO2_12_FULL_62_13]|nr:MAG: hypothetical protein A3G24_13925 [Betaproteobacteria bacterium RIFCSPLOWO2_12_FULL_62_13]